MTGDESARRTPAALTTKRDVELDAAMTAFCLGVAQFLVDLRESGLDLAFKRRSAPRLGG